MYKNMLFFRNYNKNTMYLYFSHLRLRVNTNIEI